MLEDEEKYIKFFWLFSIFINILLKIIVSPLQTCPFTIICGSLNLNGKNKICRPPGPWWSSGLRRQFQDVLAMLKVEGLNPGHSEIFFISKCRDKNELCRQIIQLDFRWVDARLATGWRVKQSWVRMRDWKWKRSPNLWPVEVIQEGWHHRLSQWESFKWKTSYSYSIIVKNNCC